MLYLFYVLTNLLYWWTFGFPSNVLVVLIWVGSIVAEVFLQSRCQESKHRLRHRLRVLTYASAAMCAACELSLWFIDGGLAQAIYVSYHFAAAALLASIVGKVGYAVMERIGAKREE